jgi:prefoldin subunit 5
MTTEQETDVLLDQMLEANFPSAAEEIDRLRSELAEAKRATSEMAIESIKTAARFQYDVRSRQAAEEISRLTSAIEQLNAEIDFLRAKDKTVTSAIESLALRATNNRVSALEAIVKRQTFVILRLTSAIEQLNAEIDFLRAKDKQ